MEATRPGVECPLCNQDAEDDDVYAHLLERHSKSDLARFITAWVEDEEEEEEED